ncbi:MmgE/PrpD [Gracilaria domingensis]|nr:MmgE/PrpD [Gracilaria domingensis]
MDYISFIHDLSYNDIPPRTIKAAKRLLVDNLGVCITGRQTKLAQLAYDFAALTFPGDATALWLDGRRVSLPGAMLGHASACDSVDAHDGFARCDGHPGVAIIPAVFSMLRTRDGTIIDGKELLTTTVMAYEICIRAGAVLHNTSSVYHSSGSWNALGVAAVYARRFHLTNDQTRHALGIAEYNAPRSLVMRCVDYPSMVKDGSGWGAMTGVCSAMMAEMGFTGAPATTVETHFDASNSKIPELKKQWEDLGEEWEIEKPRIKQYPVCFWAQAPIYATKFLQERYNFRNADITEIRIFTFDQALHLDHPEPQNTEEAQYSLPFPVAAMLVHGSITAKELCGEELRNQDVLRISRLVKCTEDKKMSEDYFNGRCACRVIVETRDRKKYQSEDVVNAWSDPTNDDLSTKFTVNAQQTLPSHKVHQLLSLLWEMEKGSPPTCSNITSHDLHKDKTELGDYTGKHGKNVWKSPPQDSGELIELSVY